MSLTTFLKSIDANPDYRGKRYFDLADTGRIFGMGDEATRAFVMQHGIGFYRPNNRKLYCVIEVWEEYIKTRNQQKEATPCEN